MRLHWRAGNGLSQIPPLEATNSSACANRNLNNVRLTDRPMNRFSHQSLVALAACLIGAANANLHAATFSDDNWISMNGHPGVDDDVSATLVDASGSLHVAGAFTVAGDVFITNIVKWDGSS